MSFTGITTHDGGAGGPRRHIQGGLPRHARLRLGAGASGALAAAAVLSLAGAGTSSAASLGSPAVAAAPAVHALHLRAMPAGKVTFGRTRRGRLTVHARMHGLTPGSSHDVDLVVPGRSRAVRFSVLTASSVGRTDSTLRSGFTGHLRRGSRLVVRLGTGGGRVAREPIARTRRLTGHVYRTRQLVPVEVTSGGRSLATPRGRAVISYSASRKTLTVTVHASGLSPGPHAAHIHLGSCWSQGPVLYMLKDLVANRRGRIGHAVRVFTNVTAPIPAHGWYLNIHQGNSKNILTSSGQPTIYFRPLLCADITTRK